jgi:V-type H+-transporting ATPase subunit H
LIKLLNEASDPLVLAVAVHDVGQYVKHYERGKKSVLVYSSICIHPLTLFGLPLYRVITDLGAKTRAMELMTHHDPDVRYRALLSVQQLVSQPWVTA